MIKIEKWFWIWVAVCIVYMYIMYKLQTWHITLLCKPWVCSYSMCVLYLRVCMCVCVRNDLHWVGAGLGRGRPTHLPSSCHPVSPKSDRQWRTHRHRPQTSHSVPARPSVCACQPLAASRSASRSACRSLSHTLINADLWTCTQQHCMHEAQLPVFSMSPNPISPLATLCVLQPCLWVI